MNFEQLIQAALDHETLVNDPPVLLDVGASGALPREWALLASHSVCIAFDPDDREMAFIEARKSQFKKLTVVNRIVVDNDEPEWEFYLTSSPFCSSVFKPNAVELSDWSFEKLFAVERQTKMKAVRLPKILDDMNIRRVDWFKTDSQGLDLRLLRSLGPLQQKVLVFDCEPGFINAYQGEDKIQDILSYMETMPFWMSSFTAKGTKRLNTTSVASQFNQDQIESLVDKSNDSSCWAEITYVNNFRDSAAFAKRELILGCTIAIVLKQYGFAAELAVKANHLTPDPIFYKFIKALKDPVNVPVVKQSNPHSIFKRAVRKIIRLLDQSIA